MNIVARFDVLTSKVEQMTETVRERFSNIENCFSNIETELESLKASGLHGEYMVYGYSKKMKTVTIDEAFEDDNGFLISSPIEEYPEHCVKFVEFFHTGNGETELSLQLNCLEIPRIVSMCEAAGIEPYPYAFDFIIRSCDEDEF
jgi:hypothetical protein